MLRRNPKATESSRAYDLGALAFPKSPPGSALWPWGKTPPPLHAPQEAHLEARVALSSLLLLPPELVTHRGLCQSEWDTWLSTPALSPSRVPGTQ